MRGRSPREQRTNVEYLELSEIIFCLVFVLAGAVLQGSVGFGYALVAAPILVLIDPRLVPGAASFASLLLNLLIFFRERKALNLKSMKWALTGSIPSAFVTAFIVAALPSRWTQIVIGGVILLAVFISLSSRLAKNPGKKSFFAAGVLGGFMGTSASIGGPPLALVMQHSDPNRFRATLSAYFVITGCFSLSFLALAGKFGAFEIVSGFSFMPAIILGFILSGFLVNKINQKYTRITILTLSTISALAVIIKALLS